MPESRQFLIEQIAEAREAAGAATLDNERRRHLQAADRWEALAARADRSRNRR